jgi:amino acid transporter
MSSDTRADRLRENSIGLPNVLFQSVTHMAPAVSLVFVFLVAIQFSGPVLPLALLIALVAMLCVATTIGQLAREMPSAGGLYTYVANGLGPRAGFVVGWMFMLIEPIVAPLLFLLFAFVLQDVFVNDLDVDSGWVPWIFACAIAVFALAYRDVRISTTAGIALGAFEITAFAALAVWVIFSVGDANTLKAFDPGNAEAGTWNGTFKGVIFAITALVGYESAAALAEETRRPRWTVPRALVLSCLVIGLFYVLTSYAWVVGTGFEKFTETTLKSANPIRELAQHFWGWGWWFLFAALVNGLLANGNAALNTASRIAYAMSRAGALPRVLSRTHRTFGTPHIAIVAQTAIGLVIALLLGWKWGTLTALSILGTTAGISITFCYVVVCAAGIVFFWRERRDQWQPLLHLVLPLVGAGVFVVAIWYQYHPLPPYPIRYGNWIAIGWLAAGIVLTAWMARHRLHALVAAERVFVDDQPSR